MRETRVKKLFDIICTDEKYYTAKELAEKLEVSLKTVRNDLKEINFIFSGNGGIVESKSGLGYFFKITDKDKFMDFLKTEWYKFAFYNEEDLNFRENRIQLLLRILLFENVYIKEDDLADKLAISKSQLSIDMRDIKERIRRFDLKLEVRSHYGIRITGSEINLRKCISYYFFDFSSNGNSSNTYIFDYEQEKHMADIEKVVHQVFEKNGYHASQIVYNNLVNHLYLALKRVENNQLITISNEDLYKLKLNPEYKIAEDLVMRLEEKFKTKIGDAEKGYITMHLSGKRLLDYSTDNELKITPEIDNLAVQMLHRVKDEMNIDLSGDLDLRISLGLHIVTLVKRIHYGLTLKNPLLEEIKGYVLGFEAAIVASEVINEEYDCNIAEDEVGYLALHFSVGIDRLKYAIKKKRILLVCSTGRGTAQLLKYRFQREFAEYIQELQVTDALSLQKMKLSDHDLIVSTIPIKISNNNIPVLLIDSLLGKNDLKNIKGRLDKDIEAGDISFIFRKELFITDVAGSNREEEIRLICNHICEHEKISEGLYESVIQREEQAPTDYENLVAVPHPYKSHSEKSFVTVAILRKPIIWSRRKVQFVVLFNLGSKRTVDLQAFYDKLWKFLTDRESVNLVIQNKNYEEFIRTLKNL